jgi:predicted HicB family RNase H-like nuclease
MEKKVKPPYQVRMSDELYATAMAKAKSLGLSFAAYVRYLISQDTNKK